MRVASCKPLTCPVRWSLSVAFLHVRNEGRSAPSGSSLSALQGYTAYETGEWARAKMILEETQSARRDVKGRPVKDGPSTALLDFMANKEFQAPVGWKGWRELTEK